jgi:hypothetical protein
MEQWLGRANFDNVRLPRLQRKSEFVASLSMNLGAQIFFFFLFFFFFHLFSEWWIARFDSCNQQTARHFHSDRRRRGGQQSRRVDVINIKSIAFVNSIVDRIGLGIAANRRRWLAVEWKEQVRASVGYCICICT